MSWSKVKLVSCIHVRHMIRGSVEFLSIDNKDISSMEYTSWAIAQLPHTKWRLVFIERTTQV